MAPPAASDGHHRGAGGDGTAPPRADAGLRGRGRPGLRAPRDRLHALRAVGVRPEHRLPTRGGPLDTGRIRRLGSRREHATAAYRVGLRFRVEDPGPQAHGGADAHHPPRRPARPHAGPAPLDQHGLPRGAGGGSPRRREPPRRDTRHLPAVVGAPRADRPLRRHHRRHPLLRSGVAALVGPRAIGDDHAGDGAHARRRPAPAPRYGRPRPRSRANASRPTWRSSPPASRSTSRTSTAGWRRGARPRPTSPRAALLCWTIPGASGDALDEVHAQAVELRERLASRGELPRRAAHAVRVPRRYPCAGAARRRAYVRALRRRRCRVALHPAAELFGAHAGAHRGRAADARRGPPCRVGQPAGAPSERALGGSRRHRHPLPKACQTCRR